MSGTPSIDILASVLSVVDSTHVTISKPLLGPISGGTTINFYTLVTTGGIVTTGSLGLAMTALSGALTLAAESGQPVLVANPVQLPSYTIASGVNQLPAASSGLVGQMAQVSDFSGSPTYRGAIGAGGSNVVVNVLCINSTTWVTV